MQLRSDYRKRQHPWMSGQAGWQLGWGETQKISVCGSGLNSRRTQERHYRTRRVEASADMHWVDNDWSWNNHPQNHSNDWRPRTQWNASPLQHGTVSPEPRISREFPWVETFGNIQIPDPPQFEPNLFDIARRDFPR